MLNVAVTSPFSPGLTTSFCDCVVVQPHEALTDLKWTGVFPTFSYLKWATAVLSAKPGCRSIVFCSHFSSARAWRQRMIETLRVTMAVFIVWNKSAQYNQPRRLAKSGVKARSDWYISRSTEPNKLAAARSNPSYQPVSGHRLSSL